MIVLEPITRWRVTTVHALFRTVLLNPIRPTGEGNRTSAQNGGVVHQQFVEVSVNGEVDPASVEDFDGVKVTAERGVTRLRLMVRDDSVLYGLLNRLQSTGLEVLAVSPRDEFGDERADELPA